jgi:hypothetical protein
MSKKRIIIRMLDFYRRLWRAFLAAFIGSMGVAAILIQINPTGSRIMFIVASIFFVLFLVGLYYDYRDARKKAKEEKREVDRKALREAVKRLNPEYTDEQIDMWINKDK